MTPPEEHNRGPVTDIEEMEFFEFTKSLSSASFYINNWIFKSFLSPHNLLQVVRRNQSTPSTFCLEFPQLNIQCYCSQVLPSTKH